MDVRFGDVYAITFDLETAESVVRSLIVQIVGCINAQQFELEAPIDFTLQGGRRIVVKVLETRHLPLSIKVAVFGHLVAGDKCEDSEEAGEEVFRSHIFVVKGQKVICRKGPTWLLSG